MTPEEHRLARRERQAIFRGRKAGAGGRSLAKIARGLPPGEKTYVIDARGELRGTGRMMKFTSE